MFSRFWGFKVASCLLSSLTKELISARNTVIFRIQNQHLWPLILKFPQQCFWDSRTLLYCWFNSYFMFIVKEKLHFSLICIFYCCLVKEGWALKVAWHSKCIPKKIFWKMKKWQIENSKISEILSEFSHTQVFDFSL